MRRTAERRRAIKQAKRLARYCRRQGLPVKFRRGWKNRGGSSPAYKAGVDHHDATAEGESLGVIPMLEHGRPDLDGPLCNSWLSYGRTWLDRARRRRSRPTLYIIAAGVANHAGTGRWPGEWRWRGQEPQGNADLWGHETDLRPGEEIHDDLKLALDAYHAGLMLVFGWTRDRIIGHAEWATPKGRKTDPSYSMNRARERASKRRDWLTGHRKWARKRWAKVR
jgi:hypothetical protein